MESVAVYRIWWTVMVLSAVMLAVGVSFPSFH